MINIETATKGFILETEQRFDRPLDEVFAFFADARNLEKLTPPWLRFEILTKGNLEMRAGLLIDYAIHLHGIKMKWRTVISKWEPPYRFVDEQQRGPYRYWIHEHSFEEDNGATIVRDQVHYDVLGGRLVHRFFVVRDLRKIFAYRQQQLAGHFQTAANKRS